jgi:hypothetical protein
MIRLRRAVTAACAAAVLTLTGYSAPADAANASERFETVQYVPPAAIAPADRVPTRDFGTILDPYGTWRDDPVYGTVWVPNVGPGFVPYATSGYWSTDPSGAPMWVSDYPWGEVTFHYGSWVDLAPVGWAWVPGYEYAPAWVTWSQGDPGWDYTGWAPLGPTVIWRDTVAFTLGFPVLNDFVFVPSLHFGEHFRGGLHHRFLIVDHDRTRFIGEHAHFGNGPRLTARFGLRSWGNRGRFDMRAGPSRGPRRSFVVRGPAPFVSQQRPFVRRPEPFVNRTARFVRRPEPFVNRTARFVRQRPPFMRGRGEGPRPLALHEGGMHGSRGGGAFRSGGGGFRRGGHRR